MAISKPTNTFYLFFFLFLFSSFLVLQCNSVMLKEREALMSFKTSIVSDPDRALADWTGRHVCMWTGIRCDDKKTRVVEIDLSGKSLAGKISPSLSNLTSLEILDLSRNFFSGEIPREINGLRLASLAQLSLSGNLLSGPVPAELGSLKKLVYLDLGGNSLAGPIPGPLFCGASARSLQYIDLSNNSLSGEIPSGDGCELKELRFLLLWSNRLEGRVPRNLARSAKLEWLDLESNQFSGELPAEIIAEMPQLQFLYLSYNRFVSHDRNTNLEPFFASLSNARNFQELELAGNRLGGKIPPEIGGLSRTNLVQIHLDDNLIYGPIPPEISKLSNLTLMNLSSNLLNGTIPPELSKMARLERVYLSNNSLSGEIPAVLGETPHLGLLDLSRNELSGTIPEGLSNLSQLRRLLLYDNKLSGNIPRSLGKCVNLEILDLSGNNLSGLIPAEVAGLSSLKLYLNLSRNILSGPIPMELSKMDMVLAVDLSGNSLSGTIPPQLGSCVALEALDLSGNKLSGPLPESLGRLPYLRRIDLSGNFLSGVIPQTLLDSQTIRHANLSFNLFSGELSGKSVSAGTFIGNPRLCGNSVKGLPHCKFHHYRHRRKLLVALPILFVPTIIALFYSVTRWSKTREKRQLSSSNSSEFFDEDPRNHHHPRISYEQLADATGGFNPSSLIGSGRFGRVYEGVLRDKTRVAVKVLNPSAGPAALTSGSFRRECRILRRTRHRNLVRIITTCSRPDFKALVLPLMPNGSLERHLYPLASLQTETGVSEAGPGPGQSPGLGLAQLVRICSDVAEAVAYLHHHSPVRVVHCDLKPSNILLDDDMTAFVADFGIARLLNAAADEAGENADVSFGSTDGLLCGSLGYIAPEYGMGKRASTQGDVYSFGVLLLEIVTGKRPTDGFSNDGSSLHEWVKTQYPGRLQPVIERALERYSVGPETHDRIWSGVVLEMVELGLMCTQYNPSTRPTMQDVAHEMGRLKEYVSNPSAFFVEEIDQKDFISSNIIP